MKEKSIAYILWCGCFLGLCGLHRLYAGRIGSGLLWLFTAGLLGIGQLLDLILIPEHIDIANSRYRFLAGTPQTTQTVQQQVVVHTVVPTPVAAADRYRELERLGNLRDKGYVTHEEFASMKQRVLGTDRAAAPFVTAAVAPGGLRAHLQRCRIASEAYENIFYAPNVPPNKLAGASESLGGRVPTETIVVLVDDTAFGGAKEGIYITDDSIFVKEIFTPPSCFPFSSIRSIQADGNKLYINGQKVISLTIPKKHHVNRLFYEVSRHIESTRRVPAMLAAGAHVTSAAMPIPAELDEPRWHYAFADGTQYGPASTSELRQMLQRRQLSLDSLVWRDGMPTWVPLSDSEIAVE